MFVGAAQEMVEATSYFEIQVCPMRENLTRAGYRVEFSVDEGGAHWPSGSFQREALDWYFASLKDEEQQI